MPTWTALSGSVRGATHEKNGLPNQDAVRLRNPVVAHDCLFLAVADGHGSARSFRSARGSALAAECAVHVLQRFVQKLGPDAPLSQVRRQAKLIWPKRLITAWKNAVWADLMEEPLSPMDFAPFPEAPPVIKPGMSLPGNALLAYGTTLLALAITPRYVIYSQLGDGDILTVFGDGRVARPLARKHQFFANETVSLCTDRAAKEFQIRVVPIRSEAPALVMLSTDGYANCFGDEEGFSKVGADLLSYISRHGVDFVGDNLQSWLGESSHAGSGDDITVGLAARLTALVAPFELVPEANPAAEIAEEPESILS